MSKMELSEFYARWRIIPIAKAIIAIWIVAILCLTLLDVLRNNTIFANTTVDIVVAVPFFASFIASIIVASAATYGVFVYVPPKSRNNMLLKLWIFPFFGAIVYLARYKGVDTYPR